MIAYWIRKERIMYKLKDYFKRNPSAVFVISFMVLLVNSCIFLIKKNEDMAERFANWGFTLLIIGLILKIIEFKRHNGNIDVK